MKLRQPYNVTLMMLLVLLTTDAGAQAISSTRLKDVIDSGGIGNIDLFRASVQSRNLTAADLERFRLDNNQNLVFAVDVNEAANGLEKSSSQGIAVDTARVVAVVDGQTLIFSEFSTATRTLLARLGETSRSPYFTMIGDGGSGRITSNADSDINGSSFDATLTFPVNVALDRASSVTLEVDLLDTNLALGDPEDFYDYSNGFEDVAIVTANDAAYLDTLAPGREEAPLVEVVDAGGPGEPTAQLYFPSQNDFYIVAFEDLFPNRGDYDFNDLVVGYRVSMGLDANGDVVTLSGEGYLVARGGGYDHDWHLRIDLPAFASGNGTLTLFEPETLEAAPGASQPIVFNGALDLKPFANTLSLWRDESEDFVNTLRDQALIRGHRFEFSVTLDAALSINQVPAAPFDPYLYVHNTGYEIHLPGLETVLPDSANATDGLTSFTDANGYPFGMILPEGWLLPIEFIDLGEAYPDFVDFVTSGGSNKPDWHARPGSNRTKPVTPGHWKW